MIMKVLLICQFSVVLLHYCFISCEAASSFVNLTILPNPGEAVCLDGSSPGYYYRPGTGAGASKWIVYLMGGGWCYDESACLERSKTMFGSSLSWRLAVPDVEFSGFLSSSQQDNPDFYNWNVVFVMYCDGASFSGYVSQPVYVHGTPLYFRGFKILQAVLDSLMRLGLNDSTTDVILTGCSAGGLATYIHADYVKSVLPPSVKFRALADGGYFIDVPNVNGNLWLREQYKRVFSMQNCTGGVDIDCINAYTVTNEQWKCFMAQYTYPYITTPIFALNSQVDTWQLNNSLQLGCTPPDCNPQQMREFDTFFKEFQDDTLQVVASKIDGTFFHSCLTHCNTINYVSKDLAEGWNQIKVDGQTPAETFAIWYFDRLPGVDKVIAGPWQLGNPSCKNLLY